ncbi:hypothetical protein LZ30DRAFT_733639 [Colletotrichum cereale]|nr:hypothetical protein LZ30DRAFT_733639 [Colletotrichum cereale]
MRSFLLFLLAPVAVLSKDNTQFAIPTKGEVCCDAGIADPSGTCKGMGLNAYGCCDIANDQDDFPLAGCDRTPQYPTGRKVEGFVAGSGDGRVSRIISGPRRGNMIGSLGDNFVGFIGCAE